jgi:hypothetical protein
MIPRVIAVRYLGEYKLEITFSDGVRGISDWSKRLAKAKPGGVFEPLKNREYFAQVETWEGTIRWPNDADICPDVLYAEITGKSPWKSEAKEQLEKFDEAFVGALA